MTEQEREEAFDKAFREYKVQNSNLQELQNANNVVPSNNEEDDEELPFDPKPNDKPKSEPEINDEISEELKKQKEEEDKKNASNNSEKPNDGDKPSDKPKNNTEEEKPLSRKELEQFFKQQREEEARLKKEQEEKLAKEEEAKRLEKEKEELLKKSSLNDFDKSKVYSKEEKDNMKNIEDHFGSQIEEYVSLRLKEVMETLKHMEASLKQFTQQGLTNVEKGVYDKYEKDFSQEKEFLHSLKEEKAQEYYKGVINTIKSEHADYEPNGELEQKMIGWVNTLQNQKYQGYLASLYQSGDPQDHILLYNEFKEANNIPKKPKAEDKPQKPQKSKEQEDLERRQRAFGSQAQSSRGSDVSNKDESFEEKFKRYKVKI